jgi:hypothetical protein
VRPQHDMQFKSEEERRKLTRRCGAIAAVGWAVLEIFFELLFGPHLRIVRSMAIGAGIGAATGLIVAALQWMVLRRHVLDAGRLIPATMLGATLSGLVAGLLIYSFVHSAEVYGWIVPLRGITGAVFVGLVILRLQWMVLARREASWANWRHWAYPALGGSALAALSACVATFAIAGVLGVIMGRGGWPYIVLTAYLAAGIAGGILYGRTVTWGLQRVLVGAEQGAGKQAKTGAYAVRRVEKPLKLQLAAAPVKQEAQGEADVA